MLRPLVYGTCIAIAVLLLHYLSGRCGLGGLFYLFGIDEDANSQLHCVHLTSTTTHRRLQVPLSCWEVQIQILHNDFARQQSWCDVVR